MTQPVDKQLDEALAQWHQQQPGMPVTLRKQIQHKLAAPSKSVWQRRWREAVAVVSCSFVAAIWWQLAQTSDLMYQVVRTEQAGRVIEIHQLIRFEDSEKSIAMQGSRKNLNGADKRQLAFQEQYQDYLRQQQSVAVQHRIMRITQQANDVLLTDCQSQQIVISKQLWQEWAQEQQLNPTQINYVDVAQGQQGQILALKFAPKGRNCTAP